VAKSWRISKLAQVWIENTYRKSKCRPKTLVPVRPQHVHLCSSVIAPQYSSAVSSLTAHSFPKGKKTRLLKMFSFQFFYLF
jgi:hypothetical protein